MAGGRRPRAAPAGRPRRALRVLRAHAGHARVGAARCRDRSAHTRALRPAARCGLAADPAGARGIASSRQAGAGCACACPRLPHVAAPDRQRVVECRGRGDDGGSGSLPVRIVAGSRKGARILAPKGFDTRPTSDRVREAAFDLIGPVAGASVLDLYAGSGAMGLEALSRGAERAVFVESERDACRTIERNLAKLGLDGARVVCRDVLSFLATERRLYDLVLVDPPYELVESLQVRLAPYLTEILSPDGLLVFETAARVEPDLALPQRTSRRYGSARLTLFGHEHA